MVDRRGTELLLVVYIHSCKHFAINCCYLILSLNGGVNETKF